VAEKLYAGSGVRPAENFNKIR